MVLLRSDVQFDATGVTLSVCKTKTIQAKEYVLQIPIFYTKCKGLCAASMLGAHLLRTRHIKEGPLFFVLTQSGDWKPLLYGDLLKFFKNIVFTIGLKPADVGLYSMRRAGAAYLQSIGVSLVDIMSAGDWHSLEALSYLISPFSRKKDIEKLACAELQKLSYV